VYFLDPLPICKPFTLNGGVNRIVVNSHNPFEYYFKNKNEIKNKKLKTIEKKN
jgi:hypothetical protein